MELIPIKANMTELRLGDYRILFSYQTPVAMLQEDHTGILGAYKTSKFWSTTTSRHINKWFNERVKPREMGQELFDNLITRIKIN